MLPGEPFHLFPAVIQLFLRPRTGKQTAALIAAYAASCRYMSLCTAEISYCIQLCVNFARRRSLQSSVPVICFCRNGLPSDNYIW